MASFLSLMRPAENCRILDLGGTPKIWDSVSVRLKITCLNLPGTRVEGSSSHDILFVKGDACSMPEFQAGDFDIVFSNSVIEHVGDTDRRQMLCNEVLRISSRYWIQTPSKYFPIEAHCGMPFWWFYPQRLRKLLLRRWHKKLPAWTKMVEGTDVVGASELRELLPGCRLITERFLMMPKSLVAYSP